MTNFLTCKTDSNNKEISKWLKYMIRVLEKTFLIKLGMNKILKALQKNIKKRKKNKNSKIKMSQK